ncbi:MAG TPA: CBS domain-containing protein [Candidatus Binatia bacterium]|jgi:CBS domain-containing protein
MNIAEVMTQNPEVIRPDTTIKQAAETMKKLDVGLLPVCDGERLIGMLSDRDITIRATAAGLDPAKTRAEQIMTKEVAYCFEDKEVKEAVRIMEEKQIRRLPIVNHDKKLVGVVSLGDIAVRTGNQRLAGKAVREVSEPPHSKHH